MKIDRDENLDKYIDSRIEGLHKNNFYLEAFYLSSAVIEHTLHLTILFQEEWIAKLLKRYKIKFELNSSEKLKEKTLGQLISIFAKYCDDDELISKLNDFNSFRKRTVHYLLDNSLEDLNLEAKNKSLLYLELVSKLNRRSIRFLKKHIKQLKRQKTK